MRVAKGTSSGALRHLLHEGVEKGLNFKPASNIVPSPSQMEKVPQRGG